ncbi:hypothetical protein R1flu_000638 [Riccia fluitans]|uniref:Thioredoxin domain-containing protein n=1 Tax=Riccia fluitans TaxID=41844 RepID=A0ABD1Y177_9MARC
MAARGAILRAIRRPVSQINRNDALCYSAASHSRSYFVQIEKLETPGPRVPSFYPVSTLINTSNSLTAFRPRLFSSDSAGASSKLVLVKDDSHFQQAIKQVQDSGTLGVVYFTAQWCGPCKQIAPYIDQLSQEFGDVTFLKVDVDNLKLEETMKDSRIGVVPTFQFHKDGKLIGELTGAVKDKLKNLVTTLRVKQQ